LGYFPRDELRQYRAKQRCRKFEPAQRQPGPEYFFTGILFPSCPDFDRFGSRRQHNYHNASSDCRCDPDNCLALKGFAKFEREVELITQSLDVAGEAVT